MSSWKSRLSAPRDKLSSALQCPFFTRAHVRRICSFSRIHCAICLSQKILSQAEGALFLPERTLSGSPKMTFLSGLKGSSICIAIKMRHKNGAPRMRHKKMATFRESCESLGLRVVHHRPRGSSQYWRIIHQLKRPSTVVRITLQI